MDKLRQRFMSSILSPTAINRYMRCPLQFYYCYVEGLKEPDETEEGIIDNRTFGIIFHHAAQLLYERLMQKSCRIIASDLDHLLKTRVEIERAVDEAFNQEVDIKTIGGIGLINREVIIQYLRQLVTIDRRLAPFTILKLEEEVKQKLPVRSLGFDVTIGGVVDRMDIVNMGDGEQIRIIDYKTGSQRLNPLKTVNDIFDDSQLHNHSDYYLQTLLYARIVRNQQKKIPVAPALLFIQHAAADDYNPILKFGTEFINDVATDDGNQFVRLLSEKVDEMFDPSVPFAPTSDHDRCRFCPYKSFCGL
jgi:ATP-dependent helicase/DNAse subunit B